MFYTRQIQFEDPGLFILVVKYWIYGVSLRRILINIQCARPRALILFHVFTLLMVLRTSYGLSGIPNPLVQGP